MKLFTCIYVIIVCVVSICRGTSPSDSVCRELQVPRYGRMECSADGSTCSVTCYPGNDLYGETVLTCDETSGEWSSNVPYCHPDYSSCEESPESLCPILTQEDLDEFQQSQEVNQQISTEEIQDFEEKLLEGLRMRSKRSSVIGSRRKPLSCHEAFCTKPCAAFPKLRYANLCRICKKRKFCYSIGYSLF